MDECLSPMKSVETTSSSVYPKIPFRDPLAASWIAWQISSYLAYEINYFKFLQTVNLCLTRTGLLNRAVRSTTETFGVGTRKAIPVNFPFKSGITFPTYNRDLIQKECHFISILDWNNFSYGFCGTCWWWNNILSSSAPTSPILFIKKS